MDIIAIDDYISNRVIITAIPSNYFYSRAISSEVQVTIINFIVQYFYMVTSSLKENPRPPKIPYGKAYNLYIRDMFPSKHWLIGNTCIVDIENRGFTRIILKGYETAI
jgi:hypothetical protein